MLSNKSPGLDGMALEVLKACWSFMKEDCLGMIRHFWTIGRLPHNFTAGVMKVIPKKLEKQHLRDSRPLTMLTIIYKLIASILLGRVSPTSKDLIFSLQQIGFIPDKSILENIYLAWMIAEWVTKKQFNPSYLTGLREGIG